MPPLLTPEQALESCVQDHGRLIGLDPRRLRSILEDLLAGNPEADRAVMRAIVIAAEADVPTLVMRSERTEAETLTLPGVEQPTATRAIRAWQSALTTAPSPSSFLRPDVVALFADHTRAPASAEQPTQLPPWQVEGSTTVPRFTLARKRRLFVGFGAAAGVLLLGGAIANGMVGSSTTGARSTAPATVTVTTLASRQTTSSILTSTMVPATTTTAPATTTALAPTTALVTTTVEAPTSTLEPSEPVATSAVARVTPRTAPPVTDPPVTDPPVTAAPAHVPAARNDSYSYSPGGDANGWYVATLEITANDDYNPSEESIALASGPTHGEIVGWTSTAYRYQPHHNGSITDSFSYTVTNNVTGLSSSATVFIRLSCNPAFVCYAG